MGPIRPSQVGLPSIKEHKHTAEPVSAPLEATDSIPSIKEHTHAAEPATAPLEATDSTTALEEPCEEPPGELIMRLSHRKAEWTPLFRFLRVEMRMGSESQITKHVLRQGLQWHQPAITLHALDELFTALDTEATGVIGFAELVAEVGRVRKLVRQRKLPEPPPLEGHAQRAPVQLTAQELEEMAAGHRRQGELWQAMRELEGALALRIRTPGPRGQSGTGYRVQGTPGPRSQSGLGGQSPAAVECGWNLADVCNTLAMQLLHDNDFAGCCTLLKRAQAYGQANHALYATTLNNFACYHRRQGNLRLALAYLSKAVETEAALTAAGNETHKPADTHLNLCAVYSELHSHHEAMAHAKLALRLLREELGLPIPNAPHGGPLAHLMGRSSSAGVIVSRSGSAVPGYRVQGMGRPGSAVPGPPLSTAQLSSTPPARAARAMTRARPGSAAKDMAKDLPAERVAVWAIALHNLATEQEALGLPAEASRSFAEAASIATSLLGAEHPVALALCEKHSRHELEAEQQLERQLRGRQALLELPPRVTGRGRSAIQRRRGFYH